MPRKVVFPRPKGEGADEKKSLEEKTSAKPKTRGGNGFACGTGKKNKLKKKKNDNRGRKISSTATCCKIEVPEKGGTMGGRPEKGERGFWTPRAKVNAEEVSVEKPNWIKLQKGTGGTGIRGELQKKGKKPWAEERRKKPRPGFPKQSGQGWASPERSKASGGVGGTGQGRKKKADSRRRTEKGGSCT